MVRVWFALGCVSAGFAVEMTDIAHDNDERSEVENW